MPHLTVADLQGRAKPVAEKKKKKWIKGAIKHPGRETERAREHGVSVHQQLETDSHSSNASLRAAGNLGLRFEKMHHGKKKHRSKLYDHPRSHAE